MNHRSEFTAPDAYRYDRRSPLRWIVSHVWRYRLFAAVTVGCFIGAWLVYARAQVLIGQAAEAALVPGGAPVLGLALSVLGLLALDGLFMLTGSIAAENVATRFEADAREELYASLLGKSQAFHDRQRAGDIMARATDDTQQLSNMIAPGSTLLFEAVLGIVVPISYIVSLKPQLALVPLLFVACYLVSVRAYMRRLGPIMDRQRAQFGVMNAGLEETVSGIEVVKASARELFERARFQRNARAFRDLFVEQGRTEARYLPLLIYGLAVGLTFLHALWLFRSGGATLAQLISTMGLVAILRFPTFISIFAFSLVQSGRSSAARILAIITAETDVDQNSGGHRAPIRGEIVFEGVSFGYNQVERFALNVERSASRDNDDSAHRAPRSVHRSEGRVLEDITVTIRPGQTVAIVGQTGSGKSALTQLVNRTYDASAGRVLIDGVDVRVWDLDALRSQIGKIEQDVFLFSRSIRENIAFGRPDATQAEVEAAAKAAQAHTFITQLPDGYDTVVGERGATLSGGQRQRIALARAFLSDPRILILDDSTSAIDSATEDQIQRAIRKMQEGRTTLLITHRLSQIRWADLILVLDQGRLAAAGTHDGLLRRSPIYRRIFARHDADLPPLEQETEALQAA
ncbi:MAG TPA: ABC transporter ATP-binding protein [Roseiflexaceae bacterium]|nr:ABC transporter ATP-binding protein [Roseiflexaceae bacterium]